METHIVHLSVPPSTSNALTEELVDSLIGCPECTSERDVEHPLSSFDSYVLVKDRIYDHSSYSSTPGASKEMTFATTKKRKVVVSLDRRECSSSENSGTHFLLLPNDEAYRNLISRPLTISTCTGTALYVILPSGIDTVSYMKKKTSHDGLKDPCSIMDLFLSNMIVSSPMTVSTSGLSQYSSMAFLRSRTLPASSHVVDSVRYLLKPQSNAPAMKRTKKRSRKAPQNTLQGEETPLGLQNSVPETDASKKKGVYKDMLCCIPSITPARADMIISVYPSMKDLLTAHRDNVDHPEGLLEKVISERLQLNFGAAPSREVYEGLAVSKVSRYQ